MGFIAKSIDKSGENKWFFLPLFLILLLTVVLCFDILSFDVVGFKEGNTTLYKLAWFFLAFVPLLLLPFFSYWRDLMTYERILTLALASFFIVINYEFSLAFLVSAIFAGAVALYFFHKRIIYRPNLFYTLLFVYVLINAISLFWTSNLTFGIDYLKQLSPLMYVPLLFCFFRLDKKQFDLIALFVFRSMMFYAVYSICSWAVESRFLQYPLEDSFVLSKYSINGFAPYDVVYAWTNHMHPTYNGLSLIFALGIGWYYMIRNDIRDKVGYFELIFYIVLTLLLLILTASRFMLVVWVLVNFWGFLFLIRKKRKLLITVSFLSLIFIFLSTFIFYSNLVRFINDPTRISFYKVAFESVEENIWHGVGLGAMTDYIHKDNPNFAPLGLSADDDFPHFHPHNQIIGDLMQTGIFGLLSILFIIAALLYKSFVKCDWLLGTNLLVYILLMCIEMPLIYPNGIFFFALVFSFLIQRDFETILIFDFNRYR